MNKSQQKCIIRAKEYVKTLSCYNCGFSFRDYPSVCDFHHIVNDKDFNVSELKSGSFKKFMQEVKKCIPLCANCHRIEHATHADQALLAKLDTAHEYES